MARWRRGKSRLETTVPEVQAEIDFFKIQHLSSDEILSEAKDLYSRWPNLDETQKRQIVENITEQVIIAEDEIAINLCYLPSSSEMMAKSAPTRMGPSSPGRSPPPSASRQDIPSCRPLPMPGR